MAAEVKWPPLEWLQKFYVNPEGCWVWIGSLANGYGQSSVLGEARVHRSIYRLLVGPIPRGYELDHLCHNADPTCPGGKTCRHRRCANPSRLEAVTQEENNRRRRALRQIPSCQNEG